MLLSHTDNATGLARAGAGGRILVYDPTRPLPAPVGIPANAPAGVLLNPDFNGTTGWQSTGGWYVEGGQLKGTNIGATFFYQNYANYTAPLIDGARYRLGIYIKSLISGGVRIVFNAPDTLDIVFTNAGYLTVVFTAKAGDMTINIQAFSYLGNNFTGAVEWIQISPL